MLVYSLFDLLGRYVEGWYICMYVMFLSVCTFVFMLIGTSVYLLRHLYVHWYIRLSTFMPINTLPYIPTVQSYHQYYMYEVERWCSIVLFQVGLFQLDVYSDMPNVA